MAHWEWVQGRAGRAPGFRAAAIVSSDRRGCRIESLLGRLGGKESRSSQGKAGSLLADIRAALSPANARGQQRGGFPRRRRLRSAR